MTTSTCPWARCARGSRAARAGTTACGRSSPRSAPIRSAASRSASAGPPRRPRIARKSSTTCSRPSSPRSCRPSRPSVSTPSSRPSSSSKTSTRAASSARVCVPAMRREGRGAPACRQCDGRGRGHPPWTTLTRIPLRRLARATRLMLEASMVRRRYGSTGDAPCPSRRRSVDTRESVTQCKGGAGGLPSPDPVPLNRLNRGLRWERRPDPVAVAIEVPHGAVVDTLLERGFAVYALNPRPMDRFRDRDTVAGAKDDRRDAQVLAAALLTDRPAFRRLHVDDPQVVQLRELTRIEAELSEALRRLANRLREQLLRFYPQALELCPAADEPWFWALLTQLPTPPAAARRRRGPVAALLREYRIRRLTADEVLTVLRRTPLTVAPGTLEAATEHIALVLPRLELIATQRRACAPRVETMLAVLAAAGQQQGHRDVTILRSFPGVGRVVAAKRLAEASQLLAARAYHRLRASGGAAPVTRQSGKQRGVPMRYA